MFLLKEVSLVAQIVLVSSVGVTRRLGAQNTFSSLGPVGRGKKAILKNLILRRKVGLCMHGHICSLPLS